MKLPISTVGYFIRGPRGQEEIYLGEKAATPKAIKRKIAGKLLSYGGDFEATDASVLHCFQRELAEESGFRVELADIEALAKVLIKDENGPRLILYYIFARTWSGTPSISNEILDPRWYPAWPLPDNVLDADKLVLPSLLEGNKIAGWIEYDKNLRVIADKLDIVDSLE